MNLKDFYDYKNQLMKDILTTPKVVELLDDKTNLDEPLDLAYTQVFPYEYIPETADDGKTYICFDVDISEVYDKTFLAPVIYIWVFAHKSRLRLPEGGVRTDAICSEICTKINGSRRYGLGQLNLSSVKRFAPMTDYQGKVMTFRAKEFNRQFDPNQVIPNNRKLDD